MKTRIISSIVGLIILAVIVYFFETPVLDAAVAFLSIVAAHELIHASGISKKYLFEGVCLIFAALFSSVYFNIFSSITMLAELVFCGILFLLLLTDYKELSAKNVIFAFFASTIVPRAFSVILLLRQYGKPTSYFLLFLSLGVAWINDIFAYFTGMAFGKHKLCENISPKKTVEGAIGGVICDIAICSGVTYWFSVKFNAEINWVSFLIFVAAGAVAGIFGDLSASVIKRQCKIKDYGNIMPGHGGIMDRFDSWLFVAPLLYIWNIYFPLVI